MVVSQMWKPDHLSHMIYYFVVRKDRKIECFLIVIDGLFSLFI